MLENAKAQKRGSLFVSEMFFIPVICVLTHYTDHTLKLAVLNYVSEPSLKAIVAGSPC